MVRLHVVVEGQTEETFVRDLLAPSLGERSVFADVHRVRTGRRGPKMYRGGFVRYEHLKRDLTLWMREDDRSDSWFTTMVDLYGIPNDVPGYSEGRFISDPAQRVTFFEQQLKFDIGHPRFLPYIQLHEFEALLFANPSDFAIAFPENTNEIAKLIQIRENLNPEEIDDGVETAPSKRICSFLPQYTKTVRGPIIARAIGLETIRRECQHFNAWFNLLLSL